MFVAELASGSVKVDGPLWANITAAIVVSAPVAWHRRRPLAVFAFVIAAGALQSLTLTNFLGPSAGFLEFMYLAWATAARTDGRRSLAALALAVGGNALLTLTALDQTGNNVAASLVAFGLPLWLAGRGIALRGRLNRELAERARRLEHERDERGRLAAGEERARIAVELQRIVLGEVREMDALASAAGDLVETDPKAAVLAFAGVEQSGRDALAEMRRLLGVLREADEAGPTLAAAAEADQARARPRAPRRPAALPLYARTIGRLEPRTQDVVVAGAWTVLLALAGATSRNHGTSAAVGAAIAALFGIALLWRRRAPLLVIAAMLALALLGSLAHADGPAALVALCVGCYAAGRNAGPVERRLSWRLPFLPAAVMPPANPPALWRGGPFPTLFLPLA